MGSSLHEIVAGAVLAWWPPVCFAISLAWFAQFLVRVYQDPTSKFPGPWYTKFTGLVCLYHEFTGNLPTWIHELHKEYGTIVRVAPGCTDISDATAAHALHSTYAGFRKGPWYRRMDHKGPRTSFNMTDIEEHKARRKLLAPQFQEREVQYSCKATVHRLADKCLDLMDAEMKTKGAIDLWRWSVYFTTDVIAELMFRKSFGVLDEGEKHPYIRDIDALTRPLFLLAAVFKPVFNLATWVPFNIPVFTKAVQINRRVDAFVQEYINQYQVYCDSADTRGIPGYFSLLRNFFTKPRPLTPRELIYEARLLIVAGSDTTSTALTYILWNLSQSENSDIRSRLIQEIENVADKDQWSALKDLTYLNAVIDETLRLYAPVSGPLQREVPTAGATLAGIFFPGGSIVSAQAYSLHRDEEVFGPDGDTWRPMRWLEAKPEQRKRMKASFMPWGGGSRSCLGMELAKLELRLMTVLFLERFPGVRISDEDGMSDEDMEQRLGFIMTPKGRRCLMELW